MVGVHALGGLSITGSQGRRGRNFDDDEDREGDDGEQQQQSNRKRSRESSSPVREGAAPTSETDKGEKSKDSANKCQMEVDETSAESELLSNSKAYIEYLLAANEETSQEEDKLEDAVDNLKRCIIGSNKQKALVVECGVVPRFVQLLLNGGVSLHVKTSVVYILGSIAKGSDLHLKCLLQEGVIPVLLNTLTTVYHYSAQLTAKKQQEEESAAASGLPPSSELSTALNEASRVLEACLSCLRTIYKHPDSPADPIFQDPALVPLLLDIMSSGQSPRQNRAAVAVVLTHVCQTRDHQDLLASQGLIQALGSLLYATSSKQSPTHLPALQCLAKLVSQNERLAAVVNETKSSDENSPSVVESVVDLMSRDRPVEVQLFAAKCVTHLFQCGAFKDTDKIIVYKALPSLVRLTRKEESLEVRILAAETLSYLIEESASLQKIAAISNHLIGNMSNYLVTADPELQVVAAHSGYNSSSGSNTRGYDSFTSARTSSVISQSLSAAGVTLTRTTTATGSSVTISNRVPERNPSVHQTRTTRDELIADYSTSIIIRDKMRCAAFRVYAALAANDEEIRKKIIDTENLMPSISAALDPTSLPSSSSGLSPDVSEVVDSVERAKLQLVAVKCLHSLSRSVQLLRTTFQDHPVWKPLMKMLRTSPISASPLIKQHAANHQPLLLQNVEAMNLASAVLANLILNFSPSKEPILESGAVTLMCQLTQKNEPSLRLNGVWGLFNMAFQSELYIKEEILQQLGSDQIFRLISDSDVRVVMKTLGLLRNLLSSKQHIDTIMTASGKQIMQAVVLILESDNSPEVKEQALCILGHIADGSSASKSFIMSNEDVQKKIVNYMMHHNTKLQITAIFCIKNLIWPEEDGARERQAKLSEIGVQRVLCQLKADSTDPDLLEQVEKTLQQFT